MAKRPRLELVANDSDESQGARPARRGARRNHPAEHPAQRGVRPTTSRSVAAYTKELKAKSAGQSAMLAAIDVSDVVMAIGPAGTGKTHIAVRKAVEALKAGRVNRIVLARPAVEAGERLGYMPGGPEEKLEPYMRPLYDELLTCVPPQTIKTWMAERVLEIAPLGFMRGRTFAGCFVVLDEAQNATRGQLKMVLTRLGYGSTMVITGDPDQSDLEEGDSGLMAVVEQIEGKLEGVNVVRLDEADVVRHPVVRAMVALLAA